MARPLHVHLLPTLLTEDEAGSGVAVVIDVLRATTTIVHALAAGAQQVVPCLQVDQARQIAAKFAAGQALLAGERSGLRIDGFDLGNSPSEFTPSIVGGKTIVFSTTNGTRAIDHCRHAPRVLIASFNNLVAVCRILHLETRPLHLVCAGTDGQIAREDALLAGALVHLLVQADPGGYQLNDQAHLAADAGRQTLGAALAANNRELADASLIKALRGSQGGRNLIDLGLDHDIPTAAQIDLFAIVPELNPQTLVIAIS